LVGLNSVGSSQCLQYVKVLQSIMIFQCFPPAGGGRWGLPDGDLHQSVSQSVSQSINQVIVFQCVQPAGVSCQCLQHVNVYQSINQVIVFQCVQPAGGGGRGLPDGDLHQPERGEPVCAHGPGLQPPQDVPQH